MSEVQPQSNPDAFRPGSDPSVQRRIFLSNCLRITCRVAIYSAVSTLLVLLIVVAWMAVGWLDADFFSNGYSRLPKRAGIQAGLWGSFWLISLTAMFSLPIGIGAAVYLEEYASDTRLTRIIKLNLSNLAGVPSIVYGILGLAVFVKMFGAMGVPGKGTTVTLFGVLDVPLPFGPTVIAGALTMSLLILPIVIIATQESLRAVPKSIRVSSLALGATRWQTIWNQVLPSALPGIATGGILAISRAMGETAPLLMVGAITLGRICPGSIESVGQVFSDPSRIADVPFDRYTTMPTAIYAYVKEPVPEFANVAAAGIVVLMIGLTCFNGIAVYIRQRSRSKNI